MATPCPELLEALRRVQWQRHRVVYVVLFGSAARSCNYRNVDIAVLFREPPSLDELLGLVSEVADATSLSDDKIDVVVLNWEQPCTLIIESLGKGTPVYYESLEAYLDDVLRRLWVCWDFEISYRKLGLLEAALEAVRKRWGSYGAYSKH